MACLYSFNLDQGSDVSLPFRLRNKEGNSLDLSGYSVRMEIRKSISSPDVVDKLSSGNGRITIEPQEGRFTCKFPNAITEQYPAQTLYYDIEIVSKLGMVTRVIEGKIKVIPEVTRGEFFL